MTLQELNTSSADIAEKAFLDCCGSAQWAGVMAMQRPFGDVGGVHATAHDLWWSLSETDWLQAFACHPRIGEKRPVSAWSAQEQKGMSAASVNTANAIAALNREYFQRFGYIFIVCATGKSAAEILFLLKQRIMNSPQEELRIAATEQMKITHLRLDKLIQG